MGHFKNVAMDVCEMYFEDGIKESEISRITGLSAIEVNEILAEYEEDMDSTSMDWDDSMDGDAGSALASAGWGTDEDYGYTNEA
ncbi:hypothetical protein UFOVP49_61 [uncultured Caudovirales phage]|uniref:Uncharacterized protein n=1 Tax=uncultured Caudovirales phage TaxID=2100421 RepID=A0A6J5KW55_9CAUD|nr:hypothetical protein UFOVP49_61 [uncultured Caudovirales phage]